MIEKHVTLHRSDGGADAEFSMEMDEFKEMCKQIRIAEAALGKVSFDLTEAQEKEREHSRSLFVVCDMKKGKGFHLKMYDLFDLDLECIQSIMTRFLGKLRRRTLKKEHR